MHILQQLSQNTWSLFLEAAPWLLLGLVMAGLLKAYVSEQRVTRMLGGNGLWSIVKAALVGAPLPLCSCGVVPLALSLRRSGASNGATVSFLISAPETGVDSIAVSYALLGPVMAIVRPIAALISAATAGITVSLLGNDNHQSPSQPVKSCCKGKKKAQPVQLSHPQRLKQGLTFAMTSLLDDLVFWMFLGLIAAGVIITFIPPNVMAHWGSGLPAMLLMLLIGIPMYICATATTPLAAALIVAGISPGTVLVLLLAGPATNMATLGIIRRELGNGAFFGYLAGIGLSSIGLGLLLDQVVSWLHINITGQVSSHVDFIPHWLALSCAIILIVAAIKPLRLVFNRLVPMTF